jgi:hypothetical protein
MAAEATQAYIKPYRPSHGFDKQIFGVDEQVPGHWGKRLRDVRPCVCRAVRVEFPNVDPLC